MVEGPGLASLFSTCYDVILFCVPNCDCLLGFMLTIRPNAHVHNFSCVLQNTHDRPKTDALN